MANRPTEVKMVAAMLEADYPDVEALAAAVIDALDEDRQKRDHWAIRLGSGRFLTMAGPYVTVGKAVDSAKKFAPEVAEEQVLGSIVRLTRPSHLHEIAADAAKTQAYCIECKHLMAVHDWPKKPRGCIVNGCDCGFGPNIV